MTKSCFEKVQTVILVPVMILVIAILIITLPDLLGKPFFTLTDKTNIVLTLVLAIFAVIQGYSAYTQVSMEKKKNKVKAISDELEKAYGPIYAILSKPTKEGESYLEISVSEKLIMDEKLSIYQCMFPANIFSNWETNIRKTEPYLSNDPLAGAKDLTHGHFSVASGMIDVYKIPLEFAEMFTAEYKKRIEKQRALLTK
jgi:hypothetical protein